MSFDIEPDGECRYEIERLTADNARLTAEVAELRKDKERLDWMFAHEAHLSSSRDGDVCNIWIRSDEEGKDYIPAEGYLQKVYNDGRTAIDAAISKGDRA